MKEEEAFTKWCPFAGNRIVKYPTRNGTGTNISAFGFGSADEDKEDEVLITCVGRSCMAWRWNNNPKVEGGYCGLVNN